MGVFCLSIDLLRRCGVVFDRVRTYLLLLLSCLSEGAAWFLPALNRYYGPAWLRDRGWSTNRFCYSASVVIHSDASLRPLTSHGFLISTSLCKVYDTFSSSTQQESPRRASSRMDQTPVVDSFDTLDKESSSEIYPLAGLVTSASSLFSV